MLDPDIVVVVCEVVELVWDVVDDVERGTVVVDDVVLVMGNTSIVYPCAR